MGEAGTGGVDVDDRGTGEPEVCTEVADAVRALKRDWDSFLPDEFRAAGASDPGRAAFHLDAILGETVTRFVLFDDGTDLERGLSLARDVIDQACTPSPIS